MRNIQSPSKSKSSSSETPESIKAFLDSFVVGQDSAKQVLAVGAYSHYKRMDMQHLNLKKSNIMLAGPTGSGKTFMIGKLAELLNVPWVTVDCAGLTASGFLGGNIEDSFLQLLERANGDKPRAEIGIVYLDEIDKIKASNGTSSKELDVGGKSVQQRLLKIIEGCDVDLSTTNKQGYGTINTSRILFIASGAFVGLKNYNNPGTQDFIDFGMIPEFMGRFQLKTSLKLLDKADMVRILSEVKDNVVDSYKNWFSTEKVELIFDKAALDTIADLGLKSDTGARGLQGILEQTLMNSLFSIPSMKKKPKQIKVTSESVLSKQHELIYSKVAA